MNEQLEYLKRVEADYRPSDQVAEQLQRKTLVAFIGAFAVGKSTLMRSVANLDSDFSEVISFTTRPRRDKDDNYHFIDHSELAINNISDQVANGNLVNYAVHSTTDFIYGTTEADYPTKYNMLATTSRSFEQARTLPFLDVKPIVVTVDPELWITRIHERNMSEPESKMRIKEAVSSLEWSTRQSDVTYVENNSPDVSITAKSIVDTVKSQEKEPQTQPHNRLLACEMLSFIKAYA